MATISLDNVSLIYKSTQKTTHALESVSLSIASGEPIALIGPSGCGKSTALQLITGLLRPTSGEVTINGAIVEKPRHQTALILQDYGLLAWKTVLDNAALGLIIAGTDKRTARKKASESLETVGLADFAKAYPAELSGGMRQRLALARAMALESDILLMDEPLSALDALTREELQGVLLDMWQQRGYSQILVTHSIEEAVFLGRRIVLMTPRPGKIHTIIDNPGMGTREYRNQSQFYETCTKLRQLLVEEGGLG